MSTGRVLIHEDGDPRHHAHFREGEPSRPTTATVRPPEPDAATVLSSPFWQAVSTDAVAAAVSARVHNTP